MSWLGHDWVPIVTGFVSWVHTLVENVIRIMIRESMKHHDLEFLTLEVDEENDA